MSKSCLHPAQLLYGQLMTVLDEMNNSPSFDNLFVLAIKKAGIIYRAIADNAGRVWAMSLRLVQLDQNARI